jgi:hypothetical protein
LVNVASICSVSVSFELLGLFLALPFLLIFQFLRRYKKEP